MLSIVKLSKCGKELRKSRSCCDMHFRCKKGIYRKTMERYKKTLRWSRSNIVPLRFLDDVKSFVGEVSL
jgi:hypothetical protein